MHSDETLSLQDSVIQAIQNIAVGPDRGRDIARELASSVTEGILNGEVDEVQAAIFFIALRMKRESLQEFAGILDALLRAMEPVESSEDEVLVIADPFDGYVRTATMTPFIPAVLAALGLNVVMHGVRSVGPKFGVTAHKVYELAGATIDKPISHSNKDLSEFGFCYADQSRYASKLFELNTLRGRIIKRTALTTLERVLLPIRGRQNTHLALGYVHKAYPDIYTRMAFQAGYDSVLLMKGVEGGLAPALNKPLRRFLFTDQPPENADDFKTVVETPFSLTAKLAGPGFTNDYDSIGAVRQCLDQGLDALNGQAGIASDSLALASANILIATQRELSLEQAVEKVKVCLDNGSAAAKFKAFCQ